MEYRGDAVRLRGRVSQGYGYALFADGTAGGSVVDVDVVKAAFNGKTPKAELDPDRLKEIWGSGAK